jgi:cold shock CspA family protein
MAQGTVKWSNDAKGYGFTEADFQKADAAAAAT